MDILDRINLKLNYNQVGEDAFGNRYYEHKREIICGVNKRMVAYKDILDPTCIPPMWHAWIHYLKDETPSVEDGDSYSWQKDHSPNLTGVKYSCGVRNKVSAEYSAWKVNE